eukprot:jgi/Bigna1/129837/aug1.10_g4545
MAISSPLSPSSSSLVGRINFDYFGGTPAADDGTITEQYGDGNIAPTTTTATTASSSAAAGGDSEDVKKSQIGGGHGHNFEHQQRKQQQHQNYPNQDGKAGGFVVVGDPSASSSSSTTHPNDFGGPASNMISLITEAPEYVRYKQKLLYRLQGGKCRQCTAQLPKGLFTKWFKCRYTGALYCDNCHQNKKRPMPWRLVHDLNPRPSFVCTFAQEYLDSIATVPLLSMDRLRPGFPTGTKGKFEKIHALRRKLALAKDFVGRCDAGVLVVASLADPDCGNKAREHLMEGGVLLYMYSLRDLVHGIDGRLLKWLAKAVKSLEAHVQNCGEL